MKNLRYFLVTFVAASLSIFTVGCDSSDDSTAPDPYVERTKIIMETPSGGEEDWASAELVWNEEFNSSKVLDDLFFFESNNSTNPDVADQLQVFQEENAKIENGKLKIIAEKIGTGQNKGDYTSSRISGKYAYQYGRIEISAKLPGNEKKGLWTKFGLIGNNENIVGWPDCGEMNIMEYLSYRPNEIYVTIHSSKNNAANGNLITTISSLDTAEEEFHAYGILWTDEYIKFYIDDVDNIIYSMEKPAIATEENWPFDQPFYLLTDIVVGGKYGGTEGVDDSLFPAVMEIQYIRVYHLN